MIEGSFLEWGNIIPILVILAVLSFTIWLIINSYKRKKISQSPLKKDLELLKEKYARHEINKQEFKNREKALLEDPPEEIPKKKNPNIK